MRTELNTPMEVTSCGVTMTFPRAPADLGAVSKNSNSSWLSCMASDYTLIDVQWWNYAAEVTGTDADREKAEALARQTALHSVHGEAMENAVLSWPAEGMMQFDFDTQSETARDLGEYGPWSHVRIYAGTQGTCAILTDAATACGKAFLASLTAAGGTDPAISADAEEGTLPAFLTGIAEGIEQDRYGLGIGADELLLSPACFSAGEWLRVVYPAGAPEIGFALVSLDGPEPEASVRGIRVIGAFGASPDMPKLARLCAWALCGGEEEALASLGAETEGKALRLASGTALFEAVEHPQSSLFYDRVTVTPDAVPPLRGDIREYDDGEDMGEIADSGVSVKTFVSRVEEMLGLTGVFSSIEPYTVQETADGAAHVYLMNSTLVFLSTATRSADDPILRVRIVNADDNPPEALGAAMLCYTALTDENPETVIAVSDLLTETPMWDELCDRWPLLSDGKSLCFLTETEIGGAVCPGAYIVAVPEP